jgi:iron complex outermembrane receptor protein
MWGPRRLGASIMALGCALAATQANAQTATPATPAPADTAAAPAAGLEEIVVTAEFRSSKLQDTPLSISAISAAQLETRSAINVTSIGSLVPNTTIAPLGAGYGSTIAAFIRGVGLGDNSLSFEPGVPIYVDDVYNGRPQGSLFDLLDLERVEVLRGPQGTLFGKNAIGGAVRLISKKPRGDGHGFIEATYGRFNRINVRGGVDLSLVPDALFLRVSASSKSADGYFKVLDYECVNGAGSLGQGTAPRVGVQPIKLGSAASGGNCVIDRLGDENVQSGRAALRYVGGGGFEINLIGDYTRQRQAGPADKYTVINPANGLVSNWNANVGVPLFGVPYDTRFLTNDPYTNYSRYNDPITNRSVPNINNLDHFGVSGTVDADLADAIHLKSVTAYRKFKNSYGRDSDGSPLPVNATFNIARHQQFTQEVQLTGKLFDRLEYATGGFYYWGKDSDQGFDFLFPGVSYQNDAFDRQTTKSAAAFVHGIYALTDKLNITGGLRFTHDDKNSTIYRATFGGRVIIDNAPVGQKINQWSPLAEVDYHWTPDIMTYALFSTGFRGGGFSPRPSNPTQIAPFGAEKLKNYEAGIKSELFDRRLRLNLAGFYQRYTQQQQSSNQFDSTGAVWFRVVNGGVSRMWGLEAELQARPTSRLHIDGTLGYLNYRRTDPQGSNLCTEFSDGSTCYPIRTPRINASGGIEYEFEALGGTFLPRVDVTYQSKTWFATFQNVSPAFAATVIRPNKPAFGFQNGYALVNAQLSWTSADKDWKLTAYARNLFDKRYFYGKLSLVGAVGREQGLIAPPTEWGVTLRRNF